MIDDLAKVKGDLKKWEAEFCLQHEGRKPGKQDIAAAAIDVQVRVDSGALFESIDVDKELCL